jgi:type II secretory pathway component GspD/PulD (secretin)
MGIPGRIEMTFRILIILVTCTTCYTYADNSAPSIDTALVDNNPAWLNKSTSVDFENTPLVAALSLLARKNEFNIVTPPLYDQTVTAHLRNVTVRDALDAVLKVTGYIYYIDNDIVVVRSPDDGNAGELVTKVFRLEYIDARQVEEQIKGILSQKGQARIVPTGPSQSDGQRSLFPSKIIAVTDEKYIIPMVEEFIGKIDIKPKQIRIEAKLIETNLSDNENFGFDWQDNILGKITGADPGFETSVNDESNDLLAFAEHPYSKNDFVYGTLTISEATLLVDFLKESGNSKLLSNPSVTTSDGKPARIEVVTTIPIQTINRFSEGAAIQDIATYQYKDIGITLDVTPMVNDSGYIMLRCIPSVEEITGWVGPSDNRQPITSKRTVSTDVLVKGGETLLIGGLIKENDIQSEKGVWLLSDIPILGELFKSHSNTKSNSDLMILIKPVLLP